jgi:hypothetical protein
MSWVGFEPATIGTLRIYAREMKMSYHTNREVIKVLALDMAKIGFSHSRVDLNWVKKIQELRLVSRLN